MILAAWGVALAVGAAVAKRIFLQCGRCAAIRCEMSEADR